MTDEENYLEQKIMQIVQENVMLTQLEIVKRLYKNGKLTHEELADCTILPLEVIEETIQEIEKDGDVTILKLLNK